MSYRPNRIAPLISLLAALLLFATPGCGTATAEHPQLARDATLSAWIDGVDRETLDGFVNDLSGETVSIIEGSPFRITTRSSTSGRPSRMAQQYVYQHLVASGLSHVRFQAFEKDGMTFRNVIGDVEGTRRPNELVIVGAHLDSQSGTASAVTAPGADDNASGVAIALYMARVFAGQQFDRTIRFVFFDGEEIGHYGSDYYATNARAAGENIVAMYAMDMLAHNAVGGVVGIHTRQPEEDGASHDIAIAQGLVDAAAAYVVPWVTPKIISEGSMASDHASFWGAGYPAVMVVQDLTQRNPLNHTAADRIAEFNWPYYVGAAKILVGGVASEAGLRIP